MEKENKINVEICCGTACYLLGAMRLMELAENVPDDLRGRVNFEAKACLGKCDRDDIGRAPYVRFNGTEWMDSATPERVVARLRELVEANDPVFTTEDGADTFEPVPQPVGVDTLLQREEELS